MRITHILRLKNSGDATELPENDRSAADRAAPGSDPVPVPPAMKCDVALFAPTWTLPADLWDAFEFRHASWLVDEVYDALRERNVSLCVAGVGAARSPATDHRGLRLLSPAQAGIARSEDVDAIVTPARRKCWRHGRDLYLDVQARRESRRRAECGDGPEARRAGGRIQPVNLSGARNSLRFRLDHPVICFGGKHHEFLAETACAADGRRPAVCGVGSRGRSHSPQRFWSPLLPFAFA